MSILVRPADTRFVTHAEGRTTHHSFSYGAHYDPDNMSFGSLIALNDEQLPPGTGYDEHRHSGVLIVTWVLDGRLHHTDSLGNAQVLEPGEVGIAETGTGISHAEHADPELGVRFLQIMLRREGPEVSYRSVRTDGLDEVRLPVPGVRLMLGSAPPGTIGMPDAPLLDAFVVDGHVVVGDRELGPGDEARITDQPGRSLGVEEHSRLAILALPASPMMR